MLSRIAINTNSTATSNEISSNKKHQLKSVTNLYLTSAQCGRRESENSKIHKYMGKLNTRHIWPDSIQVKGYTSYTNFSSMTSSLIPVL